MTTVLIDVSQFFRQPARSGVQRALAAMAAHWPTTSDPTATYILRHGRKWWAGAPSTFAEVASSFLAAQLADAELLDAFLTKAHALNGREMDSSIVLLPEPTYQADIVKDLLDRSHRGQPVVTLVYDCFPQTHPWAFPGNGQSSTSPYFRLVASATLAIATSDSVQNTLVRRLRRQPASTPVQWLGTDHFEVRPLGPTESRDRRHMLMVGTIEPRKRYPVAVAAANLLRTEFPDFRLTIVGRPGCEEPSFLSRLQRSSDRRSGVTWLSDAKDEEIARLLASATALLSIGDEGYGLPVVEALRYGCPVAFGGEQPAATLAEGRGAWRVSVESPEALAADVARWCDDAYAAEMASQVSTDNLPTWEGFSRGVHRELATLGTHHGGPLMRDS